MAAQGDDSVREELRKAFDEADVDKKGYLTLSQTKSVLEKILDFTLEDRLTKKIIKATDADGSKNINFEEFFAAAKDLVKMLMEFAREFQRMDIDQSGFLGPVEIAQLLNECSCAGFEPEDSAVLGFLASIDKDEDGRVSFNEFLYFMANDLSNRQGKY